MPPIGRRPLTAAATRIRFGRDTRRKIVETPWEDRAWSAWDRLPELHYGISIRRNIAEKFDYFPARKLTPVSEPQRIGEVDEGETVPTADQAVVDVLEAEGGTELLRRFATELIVHFDVTGRAYLVAFPSDETESERRWEVLSTSELKKQGDKFTRVDNDGDPIPDQGTIDADQVYVVWRPHPRNHLIPDSPLHASLEVAEQLILLNREMRARSLSRLPAGILGLPDSMDFDVEDEEGDPVESFERELTDRLTRPISDAGSAAAVAPWVISGDSDDLEKIRHITFDRDWEVSRDDREELIRRLANGMDLPPEILLGVADVNHWTAWQVQESTVSQHVDPTVRDILDSLTTGWFIPLLDAANVASDGVLLWRDITPAVVPADNATQHFQALRAGLIGFDSARERLGYDVEEAPTLDELELIGWLIGRGNPSTGVPVEIGGEIDRDEGPPDDDEPPEVEPVEAAAWPRLFQVGNPPAQPLAELSDLDAAALEYVLTEAEAALDRVIEKAGARLRSRVQGNSKLAALAVDVSNMELPAVLAGRFQTSELVTTEDFNPVLARIRRRLSRTQDETRRFLTQLTEQETSRVPEEDQDLDDGISLLALILLGAATAALVTPGGQPDPVDIGETRDLRLPVSEIRDAMSVVGGGEASYTGNVSWELIGNGRRSNQTLTDRGVSSLGFEWIYGDPASRVTNFDPHRRLNGVTFTEWDDEQLTLTADGAWVGGTHYRPGDHRGCLCRYTRTVTVALPVAASGG